LGLDTAQAGAPSPRDVRGMGWETGSDRVIAVIARDRLTGPWGWWDARPGSPVRAVFAGWGGRPTCASSGAHREHNKITTGYAPWRCGAKRQNFDGNSTRRGRLARRAACLRRKNGRGESTLPGGVERSDKKTWLGMRREADLRVERRASGAQQNHYRLRSLAVWSEATK